jgi:N-acetylglucosamine kinase-like BadF-type ATPase
LQYEIYYRRDSGGTKTAAAAYTLEDEEISAGRSGFGNLLFDFDVAVNHITDAIRQCIAGIERQGIQGECVCIYLGIAGIEVGDNVSKVEHC